MAMLTLPYVFLLATLLWLLLHRCLKPCYGGVGLRGGRGAPGQQSDGKKLSVAVRLHDEFALPRRNGGEGSDFVAGMLSINAAVLLYQIYRIGLKLGMGGKRFAKKNIPAAVSMVDDFEIFSRHIQHRSCAAKQT